jgi:cell wall-associated NlpC family hydrolase
MSRLIAPLTDAQRAGFIAAARTYLNVPFRHHGRSRARLDCIGLVILALADVGAVASDRRAYGRDPLNDGLRAAVVEQIGDPIPLSDIRPGDVLMIKWHEEPNHIAIVTDYPLGGLAIIHAFAQAGRVVEHALADPWPRRICEAFRP